MRLGISATIKTLKVAAAAGAAVLAITAAPASAHDTRYSTSTSFGYSEAREPAFLGDISSSNAGCEPGRQVDVFRRRSGDDPLIGSDRSDAGGQWLIEHDANGATYYAKVRRKDIGHGGHEHICRGYRSSNIPFG